MFVTLLAAARSRLAAYRAYRRTIDEIAALSHAELIDLHAYQDDMRRAAWRRLMDT